MKKLDMQFNILKSKEVEENAELRKLRSENKLLRQKVELLEAESSRLAERLIKGQVSRAEEEETVYIAQRELAGLRQNHIETLQTLEEAQERIKTLSLAISAQNNVESDITISTNCLRNQLVVRDDMIRRLQAELVEMKLREAESNSTLAELRQKIRDLEEEGKTLRKIEVNNSVAHLQEELIAVKLREAEANLSLKELRHRVNEISAQWQRHLQEKPVEPQPAPDSTPKRLGNLLSRNNAEKKRLEEELLTARVRETVVLSELKELRLGVMELETQVQVSGKQLKRQDEDNKMVKDQLEALECRERELKLKLKEEEHKYSDLVSKMRDESMMAKIRDAEHAQMTAEMNQKIAFLEFKNMQLSAKCILQTSTSNTTDGEKNDNTSGK